jgi:NarL family two-component system response regulator LiaR
MTERDVIRVITVDDHEIMRGGIKFVLLAFDDLTLVGEAKSGREALALCREAQPDVVLMDMKMAEMDGVATTAAIKQAFPGIQVLMLTSFHDKELVQAALQAGAVGYVVKDTSKDDLAEAIRAAHAGRTTLSPEVASKLVQPAVDTNALGDDLTSREKEVLALLAQGLSNSQIGKELNRSPFTIRHHVSQIIAKLGAANRAEAAAIGVRCGLVGETD